MADIGTIRRIATVWKSEPTIEGAGTFIKHVGAPDKVGALK
jgi:hypothetical protein